MTEDIKIIPRRLERIIIGFRFCMRSENHPAKGEPIAHPIKIILIADAATLR